MTKFVLKVVIILLFLHLSDVLKCYFLFLISITDHHISSTLLPCIASYHKIQDCLSDLLKTLLLVLF